MKITKRTFVITGLLTLLSLTSIFVFSCFMQFYNISLAIFGSSLLTAISSLVGYFVERNRCFEEYYFCLEKIAKKLNRYSEIDANNINTDIPSKNIEMLKDVLSDDLRELGEKYAKFSMLFDPNNRYRNFIFAAYDYIQDIKRATSRERTIISVQLSKNADLRNDNLTIALFKKLDNIFISKTTTTFSYDDGEMTMTKVNNRVADDLREYIDVYFQLMKRKGSNCIRDIFRRNVYSFCRSIFDDATFEVLDEKYHEIVKAISLAVNEQDSLNVKFSSISLEDAKYLMNNGYISGFSENQEGHHIVSLKVNDKLYYYEHFLMKYQKSKT